MKVTVKERRFRSASAHGSCFYTLWIPEEIRGAVQLTHGMCEYIGRYDRFARFLAENGYLVYGQDIAGHGRSRDESLPLGYFADKNGWDAVLTDMRTLFIEIKKDHPAIPFILFGHSMGSFLARCYAARFPEDFDGFVFCGTAGPNPALPVAEILCKAAIRMKGTKAVSPFISNLASGPYNKAFKPNRTEFDWLSVDTENVDRYVADPLCGFPFTVSAMGDLFSGLAEVSDKAWAPSVPDRKIFLIAGDKDPVGSMGKGVKEVYDRLVAAGRRAEIKLYPGLRHEILNEADHKTIFNDILLFIETICVDGEYVK